MDISDELKQANEWADEVAEKHDARTQKRDRKVYAFVDDRAAELDRAATNAKAVASEELDRAATNTKAVASEDKARAREHIKQMRDRARGKAKPPAAHPGT